MSVDLYGWPYCPCGNRSLASIVDHSCENCFSDYAMCPKCLANPDFIGMAARSPVEESLAHTLEEDGPWMT